MINRNDIIEPSNLLSNVIKEGSSGNQELFEQIKHLFILGILILH